MDSLVIIVDTREKQTPDFKKRVNSFGCGYERKTLNFGDYSAYCSLPNGTIITLENQVAIERKQNLEELCMCYTTERERFTREFARASDAKGKLYLLVEDADLNKVLGGSYRSKMTPNSLIAGISTWAVRYNCNLLFCNKENCARIIKEFLMRELYERLLSISLS